jgi:AcrR family transcriptional regulator
VKQEAGVSTGAIYTYFENKEAMIRAILERAREDRRRQLETAAVLGRDSSAQAQVLLEWVSGIFTEQGGHAARVDVNLWAEALRDEPVESLARGALHEATQAVSAVVSARLSEGKAQKIEPSAVATVLIAVFLGLEVQTAVGVRVDCPEVVRVLGTLFADYLPKAPAPRRRKGRRRGR